MEDAAFYYRNDNDWLFFLVYIIYSMLQSYHTTSGEIDFVVQKEEYCIPVEVKASENLRAQSLRAYCRKYEPEYAIRTSMSNYRQEEWMVNVPLYLFSEYVERIE